MFKVYHIGGLEDLQIFDKLDITKFKEWGEIKTNVLTKGDIMKWFYDSDSFTSVIVEESKKYSHFIACCGGGDVFIIEKWSDEE